MERNPQSEVGNPKPDDDRKIVRLFSLSSLALLALTLLAVWKDSHREWMVYQKRFYAMEARRVADEAERERIARTPPQLKQIVTDRLGRVDRCVACHLGVEDPRLKNAPQPFRAHPNPDQHPFERYGCTVCHEGQGLATTAAAAHGRVPHWNKPLLAHEYIEAACPKCHKGLNPALGPRVALGKRLFSERACIGCHRIEGRGGNVGPDLTYVGERRTAEWIIEHFKNPQKVVPGSRMPHLRLSEADIKVLTIFVLSRRKEEVPGDYITVQKASLEEAAEEAKLPPVEAGKRVYKRYGCEMCHGIEGKGGIPNNNVEGGMVPALTYVADDLFTREIYEKIRNGAIPEKKDPKGEDPLYIMPAWKGIITQREMDNLVVYLKSLLPKDAKERW